MAKEPASIRFKNPGAMWGSSLAIKWGAQKQAVTLNDGKGQGNNIAVFPTYVQGICAQLDLWRSSKNYRNKRFVDAISIWSGHNEVESYIAFVLKRVPGMTRDTVMDDAFWQSASGIAFLKAQAWHEAGKKYPAPDADWIEAQRRVFETAPVAAPLPTPETADKAVVTARTAAGTAVAVPVLGKAVEAVVGQASDVADQVTTIADKSGNVIAATQQVVSIPKPGFWNGLLHIVTSPGFLIGVIVAIGVAWAFVWFWQRQHPKVNP